MRCARAKSKLSAYLDGAVTGKEMRTLDQHLSACPRCQSSYLDLRWTQRLLSQMAPEAVPIDLGLRLRLAISREAARTPHPYLDYVKIRIETEIRTFMIPAMAGLCTAVLLFGIFLGFSALPLQAGNPDVPSILTTAPQLEQSAFGTVMGPVNEDSLVIEAYVDERGRINDYRILSDSDSQKNLTPQIKNMLIDFMTFTTFRPATSMGRPTPGRAILSFSKINVKG